MGPKVLASNFYCLLFLTRTARLRLSFVAEVFVFPDFCLTCTAQRRLPFVVWVFASPVIGFTTVAAKF